jgi:hypothetical protein
MTASSEIDRVTLSSRRRRAASPDRGSHTVAARTSTPDPLSIDETLRLS